MLDASLSLPQCPPMGFEAAITRAPRPYEPERGAEIATAFDGLAPTLREVLVGAGGSSPFLRGLMLKEADWLREALLQEPDTVFAAILAGTRALARDELAAGLRRARGRVALLTGLADLAGVWSLAQVTGALTSFADLAVDLGVKSLVAAEIDRGKIPGAGDADKETAAGMSVLAMGKMGARELNYSSDIDLICLFDETRFDPDDYGEARAAFVRVTRRLMTLLSEPTGEGYVFRTDLRLRPDPSVTPVCLSMEAAERYYESVGRTWERAAHIKARACAGDIRAGVAYLERLTPFIWRKHLDFAAIQDAHDMRLRIREHKGLSGPITLEGHNMKLGAGGIREIEFFTQTRQIIAGGRDPSLRVRATIKGLERLAAREWVPAEVAHDLAEDYVAHREIEHRLQMVNDAQTHILPTTAEGFERLAALCGQDVETMRADIRRRLVQVDKLTEGFFAPGRASAPEGKLSDTAREILERWRSYPSLRSARALEIFSRLRPTILNSLRRAAKPDEALIHFDQFLAGLPAGVQVFSMFEANPQLIDLIIDIISTAPPLAHFLARNSQVFEAVLVGDFFAQWPGEDWLRDDLAALMAEEQDYEDRLNAARRWQKEWHFRIGVHYLRALIDAQEAGCQYAGLADAVLAAMAPVVEAEFARKHGAAPGRGAVVMAMGSLGAGNLHAASDLDLIVIYDPAGVEFSEGRRPLAARAYYARLTQALVTALSAPMAEGRLYEVDMRLRPSGRQGPVATSLESFQTYQRTEAWTWEHLALTRARVVAGNGPLGDDLENFRRALIGQGRDPRKIIADVAEMRARLAAAKPAKTGLDAKRGPGHLQDIELFAQTAALLAGDPARDTEGQLAAAQRIGWIDPRAQARLADFYRLLLRVRSVARLVSGETLLPTTIGKGARDFLARETGARDVAALERLIEEKTGQARAVIEAALDRPPRAP